MTTYRVHFPTVLGAMSHMDHATQEGANTFAEARRAACRNAQFFTPHAEGRVSVETIPPEPLTVKTPEALKAETIANFERQIADYQAADASGLVLMYPSNGLCVRWNGGADCGIARADVATDVSTLPNLPTFTNGHGERAVRVTRAHAIAQNVAELRRLIEWLSNPE